MFSSRLREANQSKISRGKGQEPSWEHLSYSNTCHQESDGEIKSRECLLQYRFKENLKKKNWRKISDIKQTQRSAT